MRSPFFLVWLVVVASCGFAVGARADGVRVQVATVDGVPVYHWRTFKSLLADDVDRALVIREFQRKDFHLPVRLVDDAVKMQVADQFGGSSKKFAQHLREEGVSMENFREFAAEEIIVNAMLYSKGKTSADEARMRNEFLAKLRVGAVVKKLPKNGKATDG